jgi:hypothetical protein
MTIEEYLEATGQSQAEFARAAGLPQKTLNEIVLRGGGCHVEQADLLVTASQANPARHPANRRPRKDGHITLADLAAGSRAKRLERARAS